MSDLDRCVGLLMHEAHLLDRQDYSASLSLWRTDGLYIVPTARDAAAEPLDRLNYVYDDHDMRQRRVLRLQSGTALVTSPATHTVRSLSVGVARRSVPHLVFVAAGGVARSVQRLMAADVDHVIDLAGQRRTSCEKP